jgi:hypothetical protein
MSDEAQGLVGDNLKRVKDARAKMSEAIQLLNQVDDDVAEESYQVGDAVSKMEDAISLMDEVIPDDEQG